MASIPLPALAVNQNQQSPLETYKTILGLQSLKNQQQMQGQQLQEGQQNIQAGQIGLQQKQLQLQSMQGLQKTIQEWDPKNDSIEDFPQKASQNGVLPQDIAPFLDMQKSLVGAKSANLNFMKEKQSLIADHIDAALGVSDEELPAMAAQQIASLAQAGAIDAPAAQRLSQSVQQNAQNPAALRQQLQATEKGNVIKSQLLDWASKQSGVEKSTAEAAQAQSGAFKETAPGSGVFFNPATGESKTSPTGAVMTPDMAASKYLNIQQAQKLGQPVSKDDQAFAQAFEKMKTLVPQFNLNVQRGLLNGGAQDMAAENYFQTGQLPSGMRSPGMASSIINRAAQLHPDATGDLAGNRAAFEANKKSYDNVTGTLDTLSAFEQSGLKNLKQFTDLASKIPDTGVPWLNTPVRNLDQNLVGAQYMPAINAARGVALREIARVTSDPKLSGSLTDSAREEVSSLSPQNATLPQIKHVVEVLQNDMANVHSSLAAQKADIGNRLGIKTTQQNTGGAGKTLSMAQIQQAAKDHNVSVDEAKKQAISAGYAIQ